MNSCYVLVGMHPQLYSFWGYFLLLVASAEFYFYLNVGLAYGSFNMAPSYQLPKLLFLFFYKQPMSSNYRPWIGCCIEPNTKFSLWDLLFLSQTKLL